MKRLLTLPGLILFGLFLAMPADSADEPAQLKSTLETLGWLAGEWGFEKSGRSGTEIWMPPAGGTMLGMSRTVVQGRTMEYEFLLLRTDASGNIHYVAKPSGQAEATFKLIRGSATEAVFENLQHDFPQRISYMLKPDGSLLAVIEGQKMARPGGSNFLIAGKNPDQALPTGRVTA